MSCPVKADDCPCAEFSKEGFCDWPYKTGMSLAEIQALTVQLKKGDYFTHLKTCESLLKP